MTREQGEIVDPIHELIAYSLGLSFDALPGSAIDKIKERVLDTAGTMIAGSSNLACKELVRVALGWGGRPESSILVYGEKVPAPVAALCNGTMARAWELDDVHEFAGTHVSASMVPAAFVLADYSKATGRGPVDGETFCAGLAAGSDLLCRLRMAGREEGPEMGWLGETYAPLAVALMGARLLRFPAAKTLEAAGISYAQCAGNAQANVDGAFAVPLQQGLGIQAGILGLVLADAGLTGAKEVLCGRYGLYPLYLRGNFNHETLTSELGKRFEFMQVTTKFYPCCQGNHAAIQGIRALAREHAIKPHDVERVTICTNTFFTTILGGPDKVKPRNVNDAQFSYYYTAACALVTGSVGLRDFSEQAIGRAEVLKLAERVRVVPVAEKDVMKAMIPPIDVEIALTNGSVYRQTVPFVKGSPDDPAKREDFLIKFNECAAYATRPLDQSCLDEVVDLIDRLETLDDVTVVTDRLSQRTT